MEVFGYIIGAILLLAGFSLILTTHHYNGWLAGLKDAQQASAQARQQVLDELKSQLQTKPTESHDHADQ